MTCVSQANAQMNLRGTFKRVKLEDMYAVSVVTTHPLHMMNARALNVPSPYKELTVFVSRPMVSTPGRSKLGFVILSTGYLSSPTSSRLSWVQTSCNILAPWLTCTPSDSTTFPLTLLWSVSCTPRLF